MMDILKDNSRRTLIAISEENQLPHYVDDLEVLDKEAAAKLDDELYADIARRQFPVDSAGNTWLSAAYFKRNGSSFKVAEADYIEDRIKLAADIHGIRPDVDAVLAEVKQAAADWTEDDSNYALVLHDQDGAVIDRRYPIVDEEGVKLATDYFARYRGNYPLGLRRKIAVGITKRANDFGMEVASFIQREAGDGVPVKSILMDEVLERAHMTKDAECSALLANVNEVVAAAEVSELTGEVLEKIAEVIDSVDRLNGFGRLYGTKLLPPADVVWAMSTKEAEQVADDSLELNKLVFSIQKLASLEPDVFSILGDDFVAELTDGEGALDTEKMAAILPTLPRPDKVVLEEHITSLCG
jgi:hypothetical protein